MTETNTTDNLEEALVDLIQLKDCLSLYSKLSIASDESITHAEMFALFNSLKQQVEGIVVKVEGSLH